MDVSSKFLQLFSMLLFLVYKLGCDVVRLAESDKQAAELWKVTVNQLCEKSHTECDG